MSRLLPRLPGRAVLAAALLAVIPCACSKPEPRWCKANFALAALPSHEAPAPVEPGPPEETQQERDERRERARELEDETLGIKVGDYIRYCTNAMSASVYRSRRRYLAWAHSDELTGREANVLGLLDVNGADRCAEAAKRAVNAPPKEPGLEAAGHQYARAVETLEPLVKEAFAYYDRRDYRKDKLAKGKAMHPRLVAAFDEFVRAELQLRAVMSEITKPLAQRHLARVDRREGKRYRYHRRNVLNLARDLVDVGDPINEEHEVSLASYDAALAELDRAFTALREYGSAHRAELTDPAKAKAGADAAYDTYVRACADYVAKARDYGQCLRQAPAKAMTKDGKVDLEQLPACKGGSRRELTEKYDAFVLTSNANPFPT